MLDADEECRDARAAPGPAVVRTHPGVWLEDGFSGFEEEQRQTGMLGEGRQGRRGVENPCLLRAHGDIFSLKQKVADGAKHCFKQLYIETHVIFTANPMSLLLLLLPFFR